MDVEDGGIHCDVFIYACRKNMSDSFRSFLFLLPLPAIPHCLSTELYSPCTPYCGLASVYQRKHLTFGFLPENFVAASTLPLLPLPNPAPITPSAGASPGTVPACMLISISATRPGQYLAENSL